MRTASYIDRFLQIALAVMLVAPLVAAFGGSGGFEDAFAAHQSAAAVVARCTVLLHSAGLSLQVGVLSMVVAVLIGVPAAWVLAGRRVSAGRIALVVLPLALPAPVAVSGWIQCIAPAAASSFALQTPGAAPNSAAHALLFSSYGAALILGFGLWPVVAFNAWPGFRRARDDAFDAARLCASPARAFFQVALPRCAGEIAAGAALVFLLASNDFAVSSLLLVHTLSVEVHDQAALGKNAAAAWASLPLVVLAAAVFFALRGRTTNGGAGGTLVQRELQPGRFSSIVLFAGVILGFAMPMAMCLRGVLISGKTLSASFDAGAGSLGLSARLAAAAVLIACGLALVRLLCWPAQRAPAIQAAGIFLLAIPGGFLAVALLSLQIRATQDWPSFQVPLAWMAFGFALRFIYVPLRLVDEALSGMDPGLLESAAVLGHGRFARAVFVALPLAQGYLAAAGALVFALALGEVPLAAVLAPPGAAPATIWLFNQQHMGYDESVFALSLLLGGTTAVTVGLGAVMARWMKS